MSISIYEISPRPANEVEREQAVIRSGALDAAGNGDLQALVDRVSALFDAPMSAISIVFRDTQYLIVTSGIEPGAYRRSTSFCGHAIMHPDDIFFVPDATQDARFAGNPAVVDDPELRFYAAAPLLDAQGLPLGMICVVDREARAALTADQITGLKALADEAMAVLRRGAVISGGQVEQRRVTEAGDGAAGFGQHDASSLRA